MVADVAGMAPHCPSPSWYGIWTDCRRRRLDDIVVRPKDSASQRQLSFVLESFSPPIGGGALTDVTSAISFPFTDVSTGFTRKRTS